MKKYIHIALMMACAVALFACDDTETYAEMKEKEKAHIYDFISDQGIQVIDTATFRKNNYTTDVERNEFVLFPNKGIYMQIVRKGEGRMMEDGERITFMTRYMEYNIESGDTISGNLYASLPDYFICTRTGDSFTNAEFTQGYMLSLYNSSAVPEGWLLPLSYINLGRPNDKAAKVRLILPHSVSTSLAAQQVYPTYYEITYIPEPNI